MFVFLELSSHAVNKPDNGKHCVMISRSRAHTISNIVFINTNVQAGRDNFKSPAPTTNRMSRPCPQRPQPLQIIPSTSQPKAGGDNRKPVQKSWTHGTITRHRQERPSGNQQPLKDKQPLVYTCVSRYQKSARVLRSDPSTRPFRAPIRDYGRCGVLSFCTCVPATLHTNRSIIRGHVIITSGVRDNPWWRWFVPCRVPSSLRVVSPISQSVFWSPICPAPFLPPTTVLSLL